MSLADSFALPCRVRHTRRRGSIALRITNSEVRILAPQGTPQHAIEKLLADQREWLDNAIHQHQQQQLMRPKLGDGAQIWLGDQPLTLEIRAGSSTPPQLDNQRLVLHVNDPQKTEQCRTALLNWYQQLAEQRWPRRVEHWAQLTGLRPARLKIRPYKSRWGACSSDGRISLNTLLMMAPQGALDYVIIHELCHLRHPNHSAAFWALVAHWCPQYQQWRGWFKRSGGRLRLMD